MAIVRNITNSQFYKWEGGNKFTNIATGVSGEVPDETAKNIFRINLEATAIFSEYPIVEELVKRLGMKSDKTTSEK